VTEINSVQPYVSKLAYGKTEVVSYMKRAPKQNLSCDILKGTLKNPSTSMNVHDRLVVTDTAVKDEYL
jgi:hypothetical protein